MECHKCPFREKLEAGVYAQVAYDETPCAKCELNEYSDRTIEYVQERESRIQNPPSYAEASASDATADKTAGMESRMGDGGSRTADISHLPEEEVLPISVLNEVVVRLLSMPPDSAIYYSLGSYYPMNGVGNIDANPLFVDEANGDYRLRPNSPCINAGTNGAWTAGAVDFDGQRRIYPAGGQVDMGAFEFTGDAQSFHKGDAVLTAGQALGLGTVGKFMILNGTQLVFVAGTVTNVLDPDVGRP